MKIKVICVGKTGKDFLIEGEKEYIKRLAHYIATEKIEIPDIKNAKSLSVDQVKQLEGKAFMSKIETTDYLILLDENGTQYNSEKFAQYLQTRFNSGGKNLVFLIGGAYGFSEEIYQRANDKIALSKMTFSHQMVRMIFLEQVYRGMTILNGEPYHHK